MPMKVKSIPMSAENLIDEILKVDLVCVDACTIVQVDYKLFF